MRILQVALLLSFSGIPMTMAQGPDAPAEEAKAFEFVPPLVKVSRFGDKVKMLVTERDDYATNLAIFAGNLITEKKANALSLDVAKRLLALARHLSPKNRSALVLGHQLKRGVLPAIKKADYSSPVLARLLLTRSQLLGKEDKSPDGLLLARCFTEVAATIDPRNEDAVFEFEVQRIDHGDIDWTKLYHSPREAEEETEDLTGE